METRWRVGSWWPDERGLVDLRFTDDVLHLAVGALTPGLAPPWATVAAPGSASDPTGARP